MDRPPAPARTLAALGLYFLAAIALGSLLAVLVVRVVEVGDDRTAVRLARRVMMITAALLLPLFLRFIGSRGTRDLGWRDEQPGRPARQFAAGLAWGLLSLSVLLAAALLAGTRDWAMVYPAGKTAGRAATYLLSALVVAVSEETLARGLLFFPLWRALGAPRAALASGMIFAWAHFIEPDLAALRHPDLLTAATRTLASGLGHLVREEFIVARFANLLLMSAVLCAATARTGTIWTAAGLHAGWVWVKRMAAIVSDSVETHPLRAWYGCRTDFTDSWVCAAVLGAMLLFFLRTPAAPRRAG